MAKTKPNESEKVHQEELSDMYPSLPGNLSLWSVITNASSLGKSGRVEAGRCIARTSLYKYVSLLSRLYIFIVAAVIEPLFVGMREYKYSKRELLNAVLYVVDSGCKWRQLPHDFPAWQTVYSFFQRANEKGLWDKIWAHLVKIIRKKAGRNPNPSYALIDSQSVKTAYASEQIGYDGEKNERKKKAYSYRYTRLYACTQSS